MKKSMQNFKWF